MVLLDVDVVAGVLVGVEADVDAAVVLFDVVGVADVAVVVVTLDVVTVEALEGFIVVVSVYGAACILYISVSLHDDVILVVILRKVFMKLYSQSEKVQFILNGAV